ncbi:MAG: hypothetical protein LBR60_05630 [Fibrobacter sp.]|nr:hypothetical protein [Fibrobacter sp.]
MTNKIIEKKYFIKILTPFFLLGFLLAGCAAAPPGDAGMQETPCEDCGERGEMELEISSEKIYREWNPAAYAKWDSSALFGVFPAVRITAEAPEKCRFCHSFSAEALDFELAQTEENLFTSYFPKMRRELMIPGAFVSEEDSLWLTDWSRALENTAFADSLPLSNLSPWLSREGTEQLYPRPLPYELKNLFKQLVERYPVRYLSVPLFLKVRIDPKLGKSGGYEWTILWTLWDVRYQELVFLIYSEFTAETKTRVPPERLWAMPFRTRLETMFTADFSQIENH